MNLWPEKSFTITTQLSSEEVKSKIEQFINRKRGSKRPQLYSISLDFYKRYFTGNVSNDDFVLYNALNIDNPDDIWIINAFDYCLKHLLPFIKGNIKAGADTKITITNTFNPVVIILLFCWGFLPDLVSFITGSTIHLEKSILAFLLGYFGMRLPIYFEHKETKDFFTKFLEATK